MSTDQTPEPLSDELHALRASIDNLRYGAAKIEAESEAAGEVTFMFLWRGKRIAYETVLGGLDRLLQQRRAAQGAPQDVCASCGHYRSAHGLNGAPCLGWMPRGAGHRDDNCRCAGFVERPTPEPQGQAVLVRVDVLRSWAELNRLDTLMTCDEDDPTKRPCENCKANAAQFAAVVALIDRAALAAAPPTPRVDVEALREALDAIQSPLAIDGENHMAAVYLARRVLALFHDAPDAQEQPPTVIRDEDLYSHD